MIRILFDGKDTDFTPSDIGGLRVTRRSPDVSDFGKSNGDYALNLKLPFTDKNRKLTGNIFDIQTKKGFLLSTKINVDIIVNGYSLLKGKLYIESWNYEYFNCVVISSSIDWSNILNNVSINKLTKFEKIRFTGVRGTGSYYWPNHTNGTLLPDGTAYDINNCISLYDVWNTDDSILDAQFPLVAYGNFGVPGISTFSAEYANNSGFYFYNINQANILGNAPLPGSPHNYTLSWQRFFPAVYLRSLVRAIFAEVGYTVKGDFFSDDTFKNLCIPYNSEDDKEPQWNVGLMGRIDFEFKKTSAGDPDLYFHFFPALLIGNTYNIENVNFATPAKNIVYYRFVLNDTLDLFSNEFPTFGDIEYYTYDPSATYNITTVNHERNGYTWLYHNSIGTVDNPGNISVLNGIVKDYSQDLYAYVVPEDGKYQIEVTFTNVQDLNFVPYHILVTNKPDTSFLGNEGAHLINDTVIPSGIPSDYDSSVLLFGRYTGLNTITLNGTFDLRKGNIIELIMATENNGGVFVDFSVSSIRFKVFPQFNIDFDPAWNLPNISSRDMLEAIRTTFNLYINVDDKEKTATINSYKNNFFPPSLAYNIDKKSSIRDASFKPVGLYKEVSTKILFDDNDIYTSDRRLTDNIVIKDIDTTQDYLDSTFISNSSYVTETKEVESFYSETINGVFKWIYNYNGSPAPDEIAGSFELPLMANSDAAAATLVDIGKGEFVNTLSYSMRILRWIGLQKPTNMRQTNPGVFGLMIEDGALSNYFAYNFFRMTIANYNTLEAANPYPLIPLASFEPYLLTTYDFGGPNPYIISSAVLTYSDKLMPANIRLSGLYYKYFYKFIVENNNSIQCEVPAYIDVKDLNEMDPRRLIVFANQLFYLKEITDFDPVTPKLTKLILIRK
ncbi:hypothetical protein EKK58_11295 [Candidatus Dependentiae bacterium]|nr:MAG: hypothetical protein EKK58_11295 [Candidatus Dependentiae bacterium]